MCQIRKTIIEVRANLIGFANTYEVAKLTVDNWHNNLFDIADNNKDKTNIDFANIGLAEFSVQTKILLADSIR